MKQEMPTVVQSATSTLRPVWLLTLFIFGERMQKKKRKEKKKAQQWIIRTSYPCKILGVTTLQIPIATDIKI